MSTVTTDRTELGPILDPHLFTFKPKLNQKSTEIAQNLLSDFYDRQLKHVKRLQEFKEVAASNYRNWYCHEKRSKNQNEKDKSISESKPIADEASSTSDNEPAAAVASASAKEIQPSNERLAQLIRIYRSPLPRRPGMPPGLIHPRTTAHPVGRSAPPPLSAPLPAPPPPPPLPAPVSIRPSRRMSPINRSKSPPKVIRQAESPPKIIRRAESPPKRPIINETINIERLKLARDEAERAMKEHKIFTIYGPYPALREALRRRGWIEKFDRGLLFPSLHGNKKSDKRNNKSDDDDDDDDDNDDLGDDDLEENPLDDDEDKIPPWEENDGYYGLLSRLVKTAIPDLIWTVRVSYDVNTLTKDQMLNHYVRNGCFTTKVGLCSSLRSLPWFHSGCADEFYPRCYKLTHEDDKVAFIDDYRLTSCISFVQLAQNRLKGIIEPDMNSILAMSSDNRTDPELNPDDDQQLVRTYTILPGQASAKPVLGKISSAKKVPSSFLEFALNQVEQFTLARDHEDIDINLNSQHDSTDEQWTQFIEQFYTASHSYAEIENMEKYLTRIDQCLKNVEQHWPQYHIDGTRNIWILKPGAKSRGRGIVVYDRLDDILKLCSSSLTNDRKFVVQKYIERPLLIHNTKFDIRQWFLVTDWNPLTIWMFKGCYLRFCTEHFNLATRQQNVHLCNYSIQKHYKNNSNRHIDLPVENMWTSSEFIEKYLRPNKLADKWDSLIYPAMKDAIICSMLVAQDTIDQRRNSFELFGADFMLGEDLKPWLIEINCSPTMARCTSVTTEMCDSVLEDVCKVIIDRKYNRTNDTGHFELIHKGTIVPVPIYVGMELRVEGKTCKTGRTHNHNLTKITTPVSAPPQISLSKDLPADSEDGHPHSSSALGTHHDISSTKTSEITQLLIDPNDIISLSNSTLDKIDDCPYHFHADNKSSQFSISTSVTRQKKSAKINPNRITIDSLPVRRLSRSKIDDCLPSSKEDPIKSFDITRLPKLPVRSQNINRLVKQKLLAHNRKVRLSYQDEHTLYSSLIILNPQAVVQE